MRKSILQSHKTNKKVTATDEKWMKRAIVFLAASVFAVALFSVTRSQNVDPSVSPARPNIVFIRTDDQNVSDVDIKKGDGTLVMPNLNNLVREKGATFTNSFVSLSLCCPSRVTFLTGQHAHNNTIVSNTLPDGGYNRVVELGLQDNVLPVWVKQAGYHTMHVGKYLNEYGYGPSINDKAVPPGWDQWFTLWGGAQTYPYFDYKINEDGVIKQFGKTPIDYQTDVLTNKAVVYIREQKTASRPFFLMLDYFAPHWGGVPWPGNTKSPVPAPRHSGLLDNYNPTYPPSFNEEDVSDKPEIIKNLPKLDDGAIAGITRSYRDRLESLMAVDDGIGRLISALEQTGKLDNTYIIFTSDNGYELGEHRISKGKDQIYEESVRVPLLMRGPGITPQTVITGLVTNVDYAATILDIAGATPGLPQDGRSFMPLVRDASASWRNDFLIESSSGKSFDAIRTNNYTYAEYDYDGNGTIDDRELYNFVPDQCRSEADPYELESQHNNPCYRKLIQELHSRLTQLKTCSGASCWQ